MVLIKIKKKAPSNKTQTLTDKASAKALTSSPLASKASAPIPFIDKISVVLDHLSDTAHNQAAKNLAHTAYCSLMEGQGAKDDFIDAGSKAKWGTYKWAKRVVLPSVADQKKYPLLQCSYDASTKSLVQLRIEFVPVDIGFEGLEELHSTLGGFLFNGWGTFVKYGRLTRIDVAVDFTAVSIDDFHFLPLQGATTRQWRVNGKLQTYTHGKPNGNHTAVYDRKEKRIAQNKSWHGKEGIRIERRIKSPPISKLTDLPILPNPFSSMMMVSLPKAPPSEQSKMLYVWDLFRRAADAQGLTAALALLPVEKRTLYRKHLDAHKQPWWDPEAIWSNWPVMLDELKLASFKSWF
jgi:hypothetical protein